MSPAPSERRPAPRPFTSQSVSLDRKPGTEDVDTSIQAAGTAVHSEMIWSKTHRATCASQVLDLTACVGIRLDFLPASSAHISKLVLDKMSGRCP
jgi:hypothetical protein